MDRRTFLKGTAAGSVTAALGAATGCAAEGSTATAPDKQNTNLGYQDGTSPWPISLDAATVGWPDLETFVDVAAKTGYDGIEPWMRQLRAYEKNGGDLNEIGQKLRDRDLYVPSVIGLWDAIPTGRKQFDAAMKNTRDRMRMVSELGAKHVQTIPAQDGEMDLDWAGEAYRRILEVGLNEYDVHPALVFVKFFTIRTLSEAVHAALAADHPEAKIIPDTYHMHLSGSGLSSLRHLNGSFIAIFQYNDAPVEPGREELGDEDRVMPGDGILPLERVLTDLYGIGYEGSISVELYNPKYQEMDTEKAARIGLDRTRSTIQRAMN